MTELLTAAQMRAIEKAAIDSGQVTGLELMERAGRGVVDAVFEEWPELATTSHKAVVLCGPGNNGGDGFVVARLLKEWGWEVEVFLYGDAGKLPPDALVNYERWGEMGEVAPLVVGQLPPIEAFSDQTWGNTVKLIVDALFGTGLCRPLEQDLVESLGLGLGITIEDCPPIVAVDVPSGLCSDSGCVLGDNGIVADLTVTFYRGKVGHRIGQGPIQCGKVCIADLWSETGSELWDGLDINGLTIEMPYDWNEIVALNQYDWQKEDWFLAKVNDHKYTHGHALVLSGPSGKGGAARLAARGALRIGAGVVTVGCPPEAVVENAAQLNAIMLAPVHDADALARILQDTRISALCLGPALGKDVREQELVQVALETKRPMVLDADALSLLQIDEADGLFGLLHEGCVLTPHAGEFARVFPDIAEKLNAPATTGPAYSKVDATREAAKRAGCVVLFKGADTVISAPDGRAAINSAHYERAAPWLATAGSGDVLAGFITGLLARGFAPMQAAETAAWLHVECALSFGAGLIAEDLPDELPNVLKRLGV